MMNLTRAQIAEPSNEILLANVTGLKYISHILPHEDKEIASEMTRILWKKGI
jgi:hypothetical protein